MVLQADHYNRMTISKLLLWRNVTYWHRVLPTAFTVAEICSGMCNKAVALHGVTEETHFKDLG